MFISHFQHSVHSCRECFRSPCSMLILLCVQKDARTLCGSGYAPDRSDTMRSSVVLSEFRLESMSVLHGNTADKYRSRYGYRITESEQLLWLTFLQILLTLPLSVLSTFTKLHLHDSAHSWTSSQKQTRLQKVRSRTRSTDFTKAVFIFKISHRVTLHMQMQLRLGRKYRTVLSAPIVRELVITSLTFWRRNYFFNFSTPVYKCE